MYKLIKEKGSTLNVNILNEDTGSSLNLGIVTVPMLNILKDGGYYTDTDTVRDEWDMEISAETVDKLKVLAMPMKKPIRDQKKKPEVKVNNSATPGETDIFNLIYGNVDY